MPTSPATDKRLTERYESLVANYYHAEAAFRKTTHECTRLLTVVSAKQEVIEVLLPYYPHPLTLELQAKIALT